jgi:hypothetical protein
MKEELGAMGLRKDLELFRIEDGRRLRHRASVAGAPVVRVT